MFLTTGLIYLISRSNGNINAINIVIIDIAIIGKLN